MTVMHYAQWIHGTVNRSGPPLISELDRMMQDNVPDRNWGPYIG